MPFDTSWIDDDIFFINGYDEISASALEEMGEAGLAAVESHRAYIVINATDITGLPRNLVNSALRANALLTFANHPNARFFVFVQPNSSMRAMIDHVFRNTPYKMVSNTEEAIDLLRTQIIPNDE